METRDLCQALLDHVARELPEERDALLGLAALATFHPDQARLFVTEAVLLLMRHGRALPAPLADEVRARVTGGRPSADEAYPALT